MNTGEVQNRSQIHIFDTTLRDGQQSPGAGMSIPDNLKYARFAADLGVDVLEAGFPSASRTEFSIVEQIAMELAGDPRSPVICGLCQTREEQVDLTIKALEPAQPFGKARVHIYLPVDPALMEASLGERCRDKGRLINEVTDMVSKVVSAGMEVEFSPEGYSNLGNNFDFTTDLIRAAVCAGAKVINCPDTKGIASPFQTNNYFVNLMRRHAEIIAAEYPGRDVIWSTHNHNDLGLATYNSLAAVTDGPARQIECTINGVGERAGNASLEQVVMNIKVHQDHKYWSGIKTELLQSVSDFVSERMLGRQPHGPVVHANSSSHTSGGHVNAVLKDPTVYQAFDPALVGSSIKLIFGPLSGSNHAQAIITQSGYRCSRSEKVEICQFVKDHYSDRRKGVTESEFMTAYKLFRSPIKVESVGYAKINGGSTLFLKGEFFGERGDFEFHSQGQDSPLAALAQAIGEKMGGIEIIKTNQKSVGQGMHAISESTVKISLKGTEYKGTAQDADTEKSFLYALIAAANSAYIEANFRLKKAKQLC